MYKDSLNSIIVPGVISSPNFPDNYTVGYSKIKMIQVEQGMVLSLQFTAFDITYSFYRDFDGNYDYDFLECWNDYLTIEDGDGTILMDTSCGSSSTEIWVNNPNPPADPMKFNDYWISMGSGLPPTITSTSNIVKFYFDTEDDDFGGGGLKSGWSVSWSAVTP